MFSDRVARAAVRYVGPGVDAVGPIGNNKVVKIDGRPAAAARRARATPPATPVKAATATKATVVSAAPGVPGPAAGRVARALLDGGPQTAAALAARLGLTGTAVRRHLDALQSAGQVHASDRAPYGPDATAPRRRGRPARYYALTDAGRETFGQAYADLAVQALRFLARSGGEDAVDEFARAHAADLETRHRDVTRAADPTAALAAALRDDGYAATVVPGALGEQLCQHHCAVSHVAAEFPQLCEAETEAFSRLLGTHVTRLATLAAGDGVCTTLVPPSSGPHRTNVPRKDT